VYITYYSLSSLAKLTRSVAQLPFIKYGTDKLSFGVTDVSKSTVSSALNVFFNHLHAESELTVTVSHEQEIASLCKQFVLSGDKVLASKLSIKSHIY
jgi:hypothetical protein